MCEEKKSDKKIGDENSGLDKFNNSCVNNKPPIKPDNLVKNDEEEEKENEKGKGKDSNNDEKN